MEQPILRVEGLKTHFPVGGGLFAKKQVVKAVNEVSFQVMQNETFGLVGESGCGKSTLGRTLVKIYEPTAGKIEFMGRDVGSLSGQELQEFRRNIIREPMDIHNIGSPKEREEKVSSLLETVGLKPDHVRRYPHEFSGGQRQRISIARTLALDPKFIVCDEPISALDVSIQAQIINLLERIQQERGISYLFIAHDLGAVKHISQRIGAMYLGSLVELGTSQDIFTTAAGRGYPLPAGYSIRLPVPHPLPPCYPALCGGKTPAEAGGQLPGCLSPL